MSSERKLQQIRRAARHAETRMRLSRAVSVLPTVLTLSLAVSGVAIALRKIWPAALPESWATAVVLGAGCGIFITIAYALLRRLPPWAGALALDRHHRLDGRITNALEFTESGPAERSPMMGVAIDDACEVVKELSARRAVRIALPPEIGVSLLVALAVVGLSLLEVRTLREVPEVAQTRRLDALEMSADDLELFREAVEELARDEQSPEVKAAIERFNQLIEDIEGRRLNRDEAFRKMQEIENDLLKGAEADKKALAEALQATAKELDKSELTKPTAKALKKNDLAAAEKEMKKLADRLRGKDKKAPKVSKSQLERLRQSLNRASKNKKKTLEQLNERRAELRKQLLKKRQQDKPDAGKREQERDKRLLKKKKRELERLNREAERQQRALRRLSKLDRDLAKAAADLLRELGAAADDFDQAAEDLNRLQQEQMSDKEKEELRRRLQELRELIRQQKQGGKKMRKRLQRFLRRARGGKGTRPGQGQGQGGGERRPGSGQPGKDGQGMGQGDGKGGIGIGKGPGGASIPVDMPGGGGTGDGDQPGGDGPGKGGKKWGTGAGGDPKGEATDMDGSTIDVRAESVDSNQGPTNAEVILSAADRGFTGKPYKKVFKKYQTVAEDQIDKEKIPDGMRFYVRRYFQLIRPRE